LVFAGKILKVLLSLFRNFKKKFPGGEDLKMQRALFSKILLFVCILGAGAPMIFAQSGNAKYSRSQEISEDDGIPVIIKHLPEWESVRDSTALITNSQELKAALGERPVFDLIDFAGGTEAASAVYPQGKLLIVEYNSPQASIDADNKINARLAELGGNPRIFYRRIGNYNVFLFDGGDEAAANALFDQIKYEKVVQWLDKDPTLFQKAERVFVQTYSGMFVGTAIAIVLGLGLSAVTGVAIGVVFFYWREQKRATMDKFSDAGGMTRLNLDDLTPDVAPERLLKD
jgi:hypothetical protein